MTGALTETARAKINLTLKVRGRRADGYHEIEGLVAFAAFGDTLSLAPGGETSIALEGPFAGALDADNLVLRAARTWERAQGGLCCGAFQLTKRIPVAAGLGGGSADAAAALRLLRRAFPGRIDDKAVRDMAAELGADVPACLASRPAMMTGAGERLAFLPSFPELGVLLVNPCIAAPTADVFAMLDAPALAGETREIAPPEFGRVEDLLAYMAAAGNALEAAALRIAPQIAAVKQALAATRGCLTAAMSGSGATCFGLYEKEEQARDAEETVARSHPDWWVQASVLESA